MDIRISAEEQFREELGGLAEPRDFAHGELRDRTEPLTALAWRLDVELEQARRNLQAAKETLDLAEKLVQHSRRMLLGRPHSQWPGKAKD